MWRREDQQKQSTSDPSKMNNKMKNKLRSHLKIIIIAELIAY